MKIGLALIVKGTKEEAKLLDRCLENVSPNVDGIFITSTYKDTPCKDIEKVAKKYNAVVSLYQWKNDFADARNHSFAQVPKDYDYILWCDADDMFRHLGMLKDTIEANPADAYGLWYYYSFDKDKNPEDVHKKTMIVKNDGTFTWKGRLHEDLDCSRKYVSYFIDGIHRMHFSSDERFNVNKKRNVEIAEEDVRDNPQDPRVYWNLANSYWGDGQLEKAIEQYNIFVQRSNSDEEKYLAQIRIGLLTGDLGKPAEDYFYKAIGMKPDYPDAYIEAGYYFSKHKQYDKAEYYLLNSLLKKPPYHSIIVFSPRNYDYNPMMALAKVYMFKNREDLAYPLLEACSQIRPDDNSLVNLVKEMKEAKEYLEQAVSFVTENENLPDNELKKKLDNLDTKLKSHPAICKLRNMRFVKTESTGRDVVYYCGMTDHEWNPELFKTKGFGGSEEAVVNLAKQWKGKGYNVTVYNTCGPYEMTVDGVTYKPFWTWNYRDKQDIVVLWRHPQMLDVEINASKVFVDMHDVIPPQEFTDKRLEKVTKVLFKTKFHRNLFPHIPEEKCVIIPNGMDFSLFNQGIKKDQYLLVNTSSPDRSMDVMPNLFKKIKERVPQVRMKWAYGWDIFDQHYANDKSMMDWRNTLQKEIDEVGIESLGKIPQSECAKLYLEGNILAYPSEFAEIDCISVKKAQACGCIPVTSSFGAFEESVQYGVKIKSDKTNDTWAKPYQMSFGIDDEEKQNQWVDAVVEILNKPIDDRKEMKEWTKKFDWGVISDKWIEIYEKI